MHYTNLIVSVYLLIRPEGVGWSKTVTVFDLFPILAVLLIYLCFGAPNLILHTPILQSYTHLRLLMCSICTYLHFMYTTRDCYHQVFVFIISYAGRSFQCHIFSSGNLFLVIYILFMIHELPDRMAILSIMTLKLWKAWS